MNSENAQLLEDMIRDKLADDEVCLVLDDDDFEHVMELVSNAIGEWVNSSTGRATDF